MAKKKNLIKGAKKRKATPKFRYQGGGEAYALPTSMNATTNNMMGLGDPAMLNAALSRSTAALEAQKQQAQLDKEQNLEMRAQQSQQQFQNAVQQSQKQAGTGLMDGLQAGMQANRLARIGQGTARAGQVARASSDTGQLLTNLGNYGAQAQAAQSTGRLANAGQAIGQGIKAMGPAAGSAGLSIAGSFIEHKSDDLDPTTMNFGETTGKMMKGAGLGLGLSTLAPLAAIPGIGWIGAGVGALGYGLHGLVQRNKARVEQQRIDKENEIARMNTSRGMTDAFNNAFTRTGADMGFNVGNSMTNSYTPSQQIMYGDGGDLGDPQKRALRKQNRQTRRAQKQYERASKKANRKGISPYEDGGQKVPGGKIVPLGGGAVEFKGASHDNGGILIDKQTEVEGGETMDQVQMKEGGMSEYIFSDHLKLGGKSFGQRHKEILKRGGGQREIQNLAKLQELVASKEAEDTRGRTPEKIMKNGGAMQYQDGDVVANPYDEYNPFGFGRGEDWAYTAKTPTAIDYEGTVGGIDYGSIGDSVWGQYYGRGRTLDPEAYNAIQEGGIEKFYDDVYLKRAQDFYENSPDQAYKWLETMFNSDTPDAEMFRRKLSDADGNMLPKEQALKIAQELSTDRKVGPFHLYLPNNMQEIEGIGPKPIEMKVERELQGSTVEIPGGDTPGGDIPEKGRKVPPAWMGALPGLLGLQRNPPAPTARTVSAQGARKVNLPRINLNAERAANAAMNVGTRRQLADQVGGPAGMAASLAANQQARQQNLNIAQQESQANKDLMAREAGLNAGIAQQNAAMANQASMFNAQGLSRSDLERYQQKILDKQHNKDVLMGVARDAMQYAAQERYANALDAFSAYQRMQNGEKSTASDGTAADKASKAQEATVAKSAAMTSAANPTVSVTTANGTMAAPSLLPGGVPTVPGSMLPPTFPTTTRKYGGYIRRSNKVNRKRRK